MRTGNKHLKRPIGKETMALFQLRVCLFCALFVCFFAFSGSSGSIAQDADGRDRPLGEVFEIIEDFVREDYLSNWFASPRLIRRHFADPLDHYWGKTDVPLKEVVRDKMAYVTRWPQRYFRLINDSLEVTRSRENPYIYAVRFNYEFETKRKGDEKAGLGQTSLLLELFDKRIMIRGEGGKVLERY